MFLLLTKYVAFIPLAALLISIPFTAAEHHYPEQFVVGGVIEDKFNVARYVVSIQSSKHIDKYFGYFHQCGGSIIGKNKILTATHCLCDENGKKMSAKDLVVVVGIRNRFKVISATRIMHPSYLITHEGYNIKKNNNTANDIGMIKLKEDIVFDSDMVAEVVLPDSSIETHRHCVVAGWGRVYQGGPIPAELLFAEMGIFAPFLCKQLVSDLYDSTLFCAGDAYGWSVAVCKGDFGGPLICDGRLVGIVSGGSGCSGAESPGLYTDVYQFLKWIENAGSALYLNCVLIVFILVNYLIIV